jgi:quinol monooxygenase YgiN
MTVLMTAEIAGQTREGYEAMLPRVLDALRNAPGFLMHTAHATPTGWRVVELWESREASGRFFAAHIAPNLPKGIYPKASYEVVSGVVQP